MTLSINGKNYILAVDLVEELAITKQTLWNWSKKGIVPTGRIHRKSKIYTMKEAKKITEYANRIVPARTAAKAKRNLLTAISMFCGCGGMDLGFHNAGFDILWANDINDDCCETYRKNFTRLTGKDVLHPGDINTCKRPTKKEMGNLTVLLGGFPCQTFSNAGQRKGLRDARGRLYEHCLDYIDRYSPKFTVFENVRGFLTIRGEEKRLIEEISRALYDMDYEVHIKLLNASKYNVPQNRLRVFMVGIKKRNRMPVFRFPVQRNDVALNLGSILDVPDGTPNQDDVITLNPQAYSIGAKVPEGGSWKDIPYNKLPPRLKKIKDNIRKYRWPNFYRRFSREEIAGTITAAFKPENAGVWHPTEQRTFTAREIARIQSFPDNFVFVGKTVKSIYQMIGNAVPPLLAQVVAKSIVSAINNKENEDSPMRDYFEVRSKDIVIRPEDCELIFAPDSKFAFAEMI